MITNDAGSTTSLEIEAARHHHWNNRRHPHFSVEMGIAVTIAIASIRAHGVRRGCLSIATENVTARQFFRVILNW